MIDRNDSIVYSTEWGRMCPECKRAVAECTCSRLKQNKSSQTGDGVVRVSLEKKGRKGKGVTVISGVLIDTAQLKILARKLKQKCGSGGTVKNGTIEIQGDNRDVVIADLKMDGFNVKRSGG